MVLINGIDLAWYVGIIGNISFSSIAVFLSILLFRKGRRKKDKILLLGGLSTLLFATMLLAIVCLYLTQYISRQDFATSDTILPFLMWLANATFTSVLVATFITRFSQWDIKNSLGLAFLSLGLLWSGAKMNEYAVYWRDGAVLVYYFNKSAEQANVYFTILGIAWACIIAIYHILTLREKIVSAVYSQGDSVNTHLKEDFNSSLLLLVSIISLGAIFLIPRTDPGSITNPVTVKIIGYFFFSLFLILFSIGLYRPEKISKYISSRFQHGVLVIPTINLSLKSEEEIALLITIKLFLLGSILFALKFLKKPLTVQPVAAEEVRSGNAIYLFESGQIKWYAHIDGAVVPFILAILTLVFLLSKNKERFRVVKNFLLLLSSEVAISWILSKRFTRAKGGESIEITPVFQHLLLIPVIILVIIAVIDKDQWLDIKKKFEKLSPWKALFKIHYSPLLVYSSSVFATIMIDFFVMTSPTGKLMIGGAGIFDGIVIIPIQAALIFGIFLLATIYFLSVPHSEQWENPDELLYWD